MSKKVYYQYNPDTDNYERVYESLRSKALRILRQAAVCVVVGVAIFLIVFYCFDSPTEEFLRRENTRLRTELNLLNHRMDNASAVMNNLQSRDDNFYRVMMQMDPLSRGKRYAGLDNEMRYRNLLTESDEGLATELRQRMDILERQIYTQSLSFDQLRDMAARQQDKLAHIPSILPINVKDYTMSSGYGYRRDPIYGSSRFHEGLDFAAATGTDVYSTARGTVKTAERKSGYGLCVEIDHGYNYMTRYAHLSSISVKAGDKVNRGEKVGEIGSTGRSTGPHLHYEVRFKDAPQNPVNYYFMDVTPEQYNAMVEMAENAGHVMD